MASTAHHAPSRSYGGVSASDRIAARHEQLIDAGLDIFGTDGVAAARVTDVCTRAGLTTRYFYESFQDLPDLFRAVHDRVIDTLFEAVIAAVGDADGDPGTVMTAAIRAFVDTLADDPRRWRIVFTEPAAVDDQTRLRAQAALRRFSDLVAATARPNLPDNVPGTQVQVFALSMVGTLDHLIAEWLDGHVGASIDDLVNACAAHFVAAYLHLVRQADA